MTVVYVIMKESPSPIAITHAYVHEVCFRQDLACARAFELNKKAVRNHYWVEKAKVWEGKP